MEYLLSAFGITWAVLIAYMVSLHVKKAKLIRKIEGQRRRDGT